MPAKASLEGRIHPIDGIAACFSSLEGTDGACSKLLRAKSSARPAGGRSRECSALIGGASLSEVNVANSGAAFSGRNDIAAAGTSSVVINFNRAAENTADANPHLFTVHSPDNGATWEPAVQLTNTPGEADHGSIIGNGPAGHLAWHDSREGNLVIYYVGSTNEGATWNPEERVSTPTAMDSSTPLVALTSGFVRVLWLDKRTGPFQVYYRRRALDPISSSATTGAGGGGSQTGSATESASGSGSPSSDVGGQGGAANQGPNNSPGASSVCGCEVATRDSSDFAGTLAMLVMVVGIRRRRRESSTAP